MALLTTVPQFLYPHSRQFPFDEVAEQIVRALEKRNWKVSGITVEFNTYGSGEVSYRYVKEISSDDFKLYFSRIQGKLDGHYNDIAALHQIHIPKREISVFEDESGPVYNLYVGNNWEADKQWFMNSCKCNSKLYNEQRRYLRYTGNGYRNQRSSALFSDNDLNREYSPENDEPLKFDLDEKFREFTEWLKKNVLNYILTFDEAKTIESATTQVNLIPYEGHWDTIYSMCNREEYHRIIQGKKDSKKLAPVDRHAYFGSGTRLVPLNVQCKNEFPEIAHEGFIWCSVDNNNEVTRDLKFNRENLEKHFNHQVILNMNPVLSAGRVVAIKLKYANNVYVVDNSKYVETREEIFKKIAPRDTLTNKELDDALVARGATIIPITDYKGNYKDPIVLIERELFFDEIDWISDKIEGY